MKSTTNLILVRFYLFLQPLPRRRTSLMITSVEDFANDTLTWYIATYATKTDKGLECLNHNPEIYVKLFCRLKP